MKLLQVGTQSYIRSVKTDGSSLLFATLKHLGYTHGKTRKLILAKVNADLCTLMGGFDRRVEIESSNPCALVVKETYEDKLQRELKQTMASQKLLQLIQWCTSPVEEGTMLEQHKMSVRDLDSQFTTSSMGLA